MRSIQNRIHPRKKQFKHISNNASITYRIPYQTVSDPHSVILKQNMLKYTMRPSHCENSINSTFWMLSSPTLRHILKKRIPNVMH